MPWIKQRTHQGETQGERVTKFVVSQGVTNFMRSHEAGEWEDRVPQGST